jgi:hypothetical protein
MKTKTKKKSVKKTKTLNSLIKKGNKEFSKLSKADKRISIAQDVIEQLRMKKYKANAGDYVQFRKDNDSCYLGSHVEGESSLKEIFFGKNKIKNLTCNVCAKGALFMSHVHKVNKFQVDDLTNNINTDTNEYDKLTEIFTGDQLELIEAAFEGYNHPKKVMEDNKDPVYNYRDKVIGKSKAKNEDDDTIVLKAICNNIIKNKGTFKL